MSQDHQSDAPGLDEDDDEYPQIYADIEIRRTIAGMPETTMRLWTGLKQLIFLFGVAALFYFVLEPATERLETGRLIVVLLVTWMLWDQVFARHRIGTSHILVTSKGILSTAENVYLRWEEIESYFQAGILLRFTMKPEAAPKGLFKSRHYDVPLSDSNRDFLLSLFKERVPLWRPK